MALVMWVSGSAATVGRTVTAAPTPSDNSMPGLGSFIVFAFLAVALYFLLKNMNARLRRMSYREKEREAAEREAEESATPSGPVIPDLSAPRDETQTRPAPGVEETGSGAPHTDSPDRTTDAPDGERGGPSA